MGIGAIISLPIILDVFLIIKNSSSNIDLSPLSNIHRMEYAATPLGYFVGIPLLTNIYEYFGLNYWPINSIVPVGEGIFGPSILVLSILGFFFLKNNFIRLIIILMLLYWCGPLQLFLDL